MRECLWHRSFWREVEFPRTYSYVTQASLFSLSCLFDTSLLAANHPRTRLVPNNPPLDFSDMGARGTSAKKQYPCSHCGRVFSRLEHKERHEKTRQLPRLPTCLRSANRSADTNEKPLECECGASFSRKFFYRWMVEGKEEFPSFRRSEDWYLTKVIRRSAAEPSSLFSRSSAGDWLSRMYEQAGIRVSKVTHAPRVSAAQNADKAGVREGEVHTPFPL